MRRFRCYGLIGPCSGPRRFWLSAIAASPLPAAVVVIANQSDKTVDFSLGPFWGQTKLFSLAAGKTVRVPVPGEVLIAFHASRKDLVHRLLPLNTVQIFTASQTHRELKQVVFSRSPRLPGPGTRCRGRPNRRWCR